MENNKQWYITVKGEQVSVTEEEYRGYARFVWSEKKRKEREARCRNANGTRCMDDCNRCKKSGLDKGNRTGRPLSLEQFMADGFEIIDCTGYGDPLDLVIRKERSEELTIALSGLEPRNQLIIHLIFVDCLTERQVAEIIGLSQKGVNKRKTKILRQLFYHLKSF